MAQSPMEQVKPLAPFISSSRFSTPSHGDQVQGVSQQGIIRARKFIRCCGCVTALVVLLGVIVLVLGFTVYNVKEPDVRMNGVTLLNGNLTSDVTDDNITLLVDFSVKNPNAFTFRFGNTTTTVYYDGTRIGEGTTPPGKAKARRTLRFNVTMEIMPKKLRDNPRLRSDLSDNALNISSYTKVDGKVKILNLFKRKVVVELNCTIQYNIVTASTTPGDNCIRRVNI